MNKISMQTVNIIFHKIHFFDHICSSQLHNSCLEFISTFYSMTMKGNILKMIDLQISPHGIPYCEQHGVQFYILNACDCD